MPPFKTKNVPLKTITIPPYLLIIFSLTLISFGDPYLIKRISDKDFRYEFYTTDKKINPKTSKTYFWFKGGLIHEAQGGIAGELLNDKFTKMYHSNQLAEQGQFKNGLRVGEWKTWHKNGILASILHYSNGMRSGKFFRYDEIGNLVENGKFSSNLKTGKWTNAETQEVTTYKDGVIVKKKEVLTKSEKYRLKQENIKTENAKESQKDQENTSDALKLKSYKAKTKEEKVQAKEKDKKDREIAAADKKAKKEADKEAKKIAKEKAKNEPKKDSKIESFFKNIFKKKDKAPK